MNLVLIMAAFVFLVGLNAFFVFAEFAIVKVRSSQIDEMIDRGTKGAEIVRRIHDKLDEYLSVCQVGITFASIALGFVGELVAAKLLIPLLAGIDARGRGGTIAIHVVATGLSVVSVSFLHILLGEQVPKLAAIRDARGAALLTAGTLKIFHGVFLLPLWLLNSSAHAILGLFGIGATSEREQLSEDELRILLERGQGSGLLSFRRLLFMENIFDLGEMKVRDAMRSNAAAITLSPTMSSDEVARIVRTKPFSRFLVVPEKAPLPIGYVHVKDMRYRPAAGEELAAITRQALLVDETQPLEQVLATMQAKRCQIAIVIHDGRWTGFLTMEDILEEIVGTIGDEFEEDPPIALASVLRPERVVLGIEAATIAGGVRLALSRIARSELPAPPEDILRAVTERERLASTYMGKGIAIPHAKLQVLAGPALLVIRSETGIPIEGGQERAKLLFVLVTPAAEPRIHQKLLVRVAELIEGSEYVVERLASATSPGEVHEIITTGEQASID